MCGAGIATVGDEGLGNSACLVGLGGGRALAVDVPRGLRQSGPLRRLLTLPDATAGGGPPERADAGPPLAAGQ